jgi:ribosomal protein L34E
MISYRDTAPRLHPSGPGRPLGQALLGSRHSSGLFSPSPSCARRRSPLGEMPTKRFISVNTQARDGRTPLRDNSVVVSAACQQHVCAGAAARSSATVTM